MSSSQESRSGKTGRQRATPAAGRRGGGPKALAQALPAVAKKILGKRGFAEGSLINDWSSVVGADIARRCIPKQLSFRRASDRRDGTLTLRVESGFATELVYLEHQLLERINAHFGYRAVAKFKLLQGPVIDRSSSGCPRPKVLSPQAGADLAAKVSEVEDEDLRKALTDLGTAVYSRPEK